MNSFRTREDSARVLARYPELASDVPGRLPAAQGAAHPGLRPLAGVVAGAARSTSGARRGTATSTPALQTSGVLRALLDAGIRVRLRLQRRQPGRRARPRDPRLDRDRARPVRHGGVRPLRGRQEGRPRGAPQRRPPHAARVQPVPRPEELENFQDIGRWRYFNTNTLWVDLRRAGARARRQRRRRRAAADREPQAGRSRTTRPRRR